MRLIHDCVDDYFGGDEAGSKPGHDVITLDVREAFDRALGANVVVVRLLMNGGYEDGSSERPGLRDVVTFGIRGGAQKTLEFKTTDNEQFTGVGFDRVDGPLPVIYQGSQDGTRFALEGIARTTTLGLAVGKVIEGYRVDSYIDDDRGDFMPGTYETPLGPAPEATGCSQAGNTYRPDYKLRGPTYYAKLEGPSASTYLPHGATKLANLDAQNLLGDSAQTFTFEAAPGPGVQAQFHNAATNTHTGTYTVALAADQPANIHVDLTGVQAGSSGVVTVTLYTDLGGRNQVAVAYEVGPAGATSGGPDTTSPDDPAGGAKGSPGAGLPVAIGLLAATALGLRRRR